MFTKKIISVLLSFIILVQPLNQIVYADNENLTNTQDVSIVSQMVQTSTSTPITVDTGNFIFDKDTKTITGYKSKDVPVNLEIPAQIDGIPVEHIGGKEAFRYSSSGKSKLNNPLESVTFPEGLKSIGYWAFQGNNLKELILPKSLESLDIRSFALNKNLEKVDFQGNTLITTLPEEVFYSCKISDIQIPASVEIIQDSALKDNYLTNINLSDNVKEIGTQAFALNYIDKVNLGENLTQLNKNVKGKEGSNGIFFRNFYEEKKTRLTRIYTNSNLATAKNTNAIVNPVSLTVKFVNEENSEIQPSLKIVGIEKKKIVVTKHPKYNFDVTNIADGDLSYIKDYIVPTDKTEFHTKFFEEMSNNYFKKGENHTITPEDIKTYQTPQPQDMTFHQEDNEITFVYKKKKAFKFELKGENIKSNISGNEVFAGDEAIIFIDEPKGKVVDTFTVNGEDKKAELKNEGLKKVYKFSIEGYTRVEVSYKDEPVSYDKELKIKAEKSELNLGEKTKIKVFYRGAEIDSSNPDLLWKLDKEDMAKFDANTGELTAVSSGTFILSAMIKDNSNIKDELEFKANPIKVKIRIEGNYHSILETTQVEVDKLYVKKGQNYYTDISFEKPVVFLAAEKAIRQNTNIKTSEKDEFDFSSNGNWMKKIGKDVDYKNSGSFMLVVNGKHTNWGAGEQEIKNDDYIVIYYMENWGDMLYTYFQDEEIETEIGKEVKLTLNSLPFSMGGSTNPPGIVKNAILMNDKNPLLDSDNNEITSNENGEFIHTFDKEGTYHISAIRYNDEGQVNISRPYLKLIVKSPDLSDIEKWAKNKMNLIADDYAKKEELKDWWAISEIGKLGKPVSKKSLDFIYSKAIDKDGKLTKDTGIILKTVLALRASGIDPQNYYGYDLVEKLAKADIDKSIWIQAPAMWALNSDDYKKDDLINKQIQSLLSKRAKSGLWESEYSGTVYWSDDTGSALYALAPFYNTDQEVKDAFEKAVDAISKKQLSNGDITKGKGNNNSLVMIIGGLVSANPDYIKDSRLIKNGNTLLHALKAYDIENTAEFAWKIEDTKGSPFATEQSFRALISYFSVKDGKGYVFDYKNTPKKSYPDNNVKKEYKLDVKGGNGSGNYEAGTSISITATDVSGKIFDKWTAKGINLEKPREKTITITMPENDVILQAHWKESGSSDDGGSTPSKTKVMLSIDKLTINKGYVVETLELDFSPGESVWDITKKLLDEKKIPYEAEFNSQYNSIYIKSIDGDGELDHGSGSGWMYTLNGQFPDKGANLIYPKSKDIIRLRYTTNLGKDIGGNFDDLPSLKEKLNQYLTSAKAYNKNEYTKDSFENLTKAVYMGQKIFDNPNSIDIDFLEAIQKLDKAIKSMQRLSSSSITDNYREDLKQKIEEIDNMKIDSSKYDKEAYESFIKSLNKAKKAYEKGEISYDELKEIIEDLEKSLNQLNDKKITTLPQEENKEENKSSKENLPKVDYDYKYPDQKNISSWAKEYISKARSYKLMQGDKNGNFNPKKTISRAEIATIISNFIGDVNYDKNSKTFKDVETDKWYFKAIDKVTSLGILNGVSKDSFNPQDKLTREQLAVIIVNMMKYEKSDSSNMPKDIAKASNWSKNAISIVYSKGIMQGDKENFNPKQKVSREMVAVIMVKLYEEKHNKKTEN